MLDRNFRLPKVQMSIPAPSPCPIAVGIDGNRASEDRHAIIDILVEVIQYMRDTCKRHGIVTSRSQCATREIECNAAVTVLVFDLPDRIKDATAVSRNSHGLAKIRVPFNGP